MNTWAEMLFDRPAYLLPVVEYLMKKCFQRAARSVSTIWA
jgi:hypothetical protein